VASDLDLGSSSASTATRSRTRHPWILKFDAALEGEQIERVKALKAAATPPSSSSA
jgi:hypothetical protein